MAEIRTISNIMSVDEGIITTVGGETFDASEVLGGLAGGTQYTIAAPNSVNKERADLILGTEDPAQEINDTIAMLHTMRASVDVAIRIDFMGGNIDVGTKTDGSAIVIPLGYDNIHLYGNGVKITGDIEDLLQVDFYSTLENKANGVIVDGFEVVNNLFGYGLSNSGTNCTISGNTCSSGSEGRSGLYNAGTNCTITGNICDGGYGQSLSNYGTNCTITGNTCSSSDIGLYNTGTNCTITGNTCSGSGDYSTGLSNDGTNCTITGNTCSGSGSGSGGLYNSGTNCTITGNTCSGSGSGSGSGYGLYCDATDTVNKCIIIGNVCLNGGISVKTGTCLPATQAAMADVNTGTITIRE